MADGETSQPMPAEFQSEHELSWVKRFVDCGGGNAAAGTAAYRRRYPDGAVIDTAAPTADMNPPPTAQVIDLPPRAPFIQQELDLGQNMGQYLEQQALPRPLPLDPEQQQELGFVISSMIFAAFPHRAVKKPVYTRKDGNVSLSIMNDEEIGIPYGRYPRILLAHICTLAKRTGSKRIELGSSQADFFRQLGLGSDGGGTRSQAALLKNSAIQLFTAAIRWRELGDNKLNFKNLEVASQGSLIWTPHTTQGSMDKYEWQGFIDLTDSFLGQCVKHSFPIDLKVIQSFRSSVAIDIYVWLTYRMNTLNKPLRITWRQLKFQFGSEYKDDALGIKNFKAKFIAQLKLVLAHYGSANVEVTPDHLELRPSNTHIPRSITR